MDVVTVSPWTKSAPSLGPIQSLMDALQANGWKPRPIVNGAAVYFHPTYGTMEIRLDVNDTDRAVPFVDGRRVPFRHAMRLAVGEP